MAAGTTSAPQGDGKNPIATFDIGGAKFQGIVPCDSLGNPLDEAIPSFSASLTNSVVTAKAQPGRMAGYYFYNPHATNTAYVPFFDTVASPNLGVDIPYFVLPIPPLSAANLAVSVKFAQAIKYAATSAPLGGLAPSSPLVATVWYR